MRCASEWFYSPIWPRARAQSGYAQSHLQINDWCNPRRWQFLERAAANICSEMRHWCVVLKAFETMAKSGKQAPANTNLGNFLTAI